MAWAFIIPVMVLFGLLTVATVVGSVLFLAGRPRSGVRRVGGSLALVCGCLLSLVVLGGLSLTAVRLQSSDSVHQRQEQEAAARREEIERLEARLLREAAATSSTDAGLTRLPDDESISPADALTPLTGHDDRTSVVPDAGQRPDWVDAPASKAGDVVRLAIAGQQFATVEEARHDVAQAARTQLLADFEQTYGSSAYGLRSLSDDELRSLAVRNEFVETVDRDFGSFFAPMHRVWWQVELSPAVRSELYPMWRAKEQEIRTLVVAGNLALATMALAALSWFTRKKPVAPPPPPPTTNPFVLGVGAATLFAQRCRRWWKC